jgi:SMODS and SLOG-associating 2TM effector domain 2
MARLVNIETPRFPELDWSADDHRAPLDALYEYAVATAHQARQWYVDRHEAKRRWGRTLRLFAILMGVIAVIVPILAQLWSEVPPGLSTVAIALGAVFISLDRFFGASAGWMRFIQAEQRLTERLSRFEFDWAAIQLASTDPTDSAALSAHLDLVRGLVEDVQRIVADETSMWIEEFNNGLALVESNLKNGAA